MLFNKSNRKESPVRPKDNSLSKYLAVIPAGGKGYGGEVSAPAKVVAVLLEEVLSTPISVDDSDRPWPGTKKGMLFEFIERSGLDGCSNADQFDWAMDDEAMNPEKLDDGKVIEGRLSSLRVHLRTKHLITKVSPGVWRASDSEERERAKRKAKKSAKHSRPLPSHTSKFGIVHYLLPADGSKIRASVIIDQLVNDPVFKSQNKDQSGVSADVSSALGRLRTQGLAISEGGRYDMTWGRAKPEKAKAASRIFRNAVQWEMATFQIVELNWVVGISSKDIAYTIQEGGVEEYSGLEGLLKGLSLEQIIFIVEEAIVRLLDEDKGGIVKNRDGLYTKA